MLTCVNHVWGNVAIVLYYVRVMPLYFTSGASVLQQTKKTFNWIMESKQSGSHEAGGPLHLRTKRPPTPDSQIMFCETALSLALSPKNCVSCFLPKGSRPWGPYKLASISTRAAHFLVDLIRKNLPVQVETGRCLSRRKWGRALQQGRVGTTCR